MTYPSRIWRPIAGFSGYSVSNDGLVKSHARVVKHGNRWNKFDATRTIAEKILKPETTTHGYLRVRLSDGQLSIRQLVHRLVAQAFLPNPECKPQVNHLNGISCDDRSDNLEWSTCGDNHKHAYRMLKRKSRTQRLTEEDVTIIRKRYAQSQSSVLDLSAEFGTTPTNIYYVISRKTWRNVA